MAARRGADGKWSAPQQLSDPSATVYGDEKFAPQIVAEPTGQVTVLWAERIEAEERTRVRTARLVPSIGWSAPQTLAEDGWGPSLAIDYGGQVFAAWVDDAGARVRVRVASGLWRDPRTIAETSGTSHTDDGSTYFDTSHVVWAAKLISCNYGVQAVWNAQKIESWTTYYHEGEEGETTWGPSLLYVKPLPSGSNGWPAAAAAVEPSGVASDHGVGQSVCGPSGDLTVAGVGNYVTSSDFVYADHRFATATKTSYSGWLAPDVIATSKGDRAPELGISSLRLATTADGTTLRAVEKAGQVTLASRPRVGTWSPESPLLPSSSTATSPFLYVSPSDGEQSVFVGREGDVTPRAEVRQRASTSGAWSAPVAISTPGAIVGGIQAAGHRDGTMTALVLEKTAASSWRLTSSTQSTPPPVSARVPVKLSGSTLTYDIDLNRTASACPAANSIWVTPTNTVNGVKTNVPVVKRTLAIKAGVATTCTITGTVTLSRAPSRTGLTVSTGAAGLSTRTVVPG